MSSLARGLIDYHIHTVFSDGKSTHNDYIASALKTGLTEIGFTDHICHRPVPWSMELSRIAELKKTVTTLKNLELPGVKLGIEMDYLPGHESDIHSVIRALEPDYVIGSVHFIGDWNYDSPLYISRFSERDLMEIYSEYFDLVGKAAKSGLFDIIGHADLIKKFGHVPGKPLTDLYSKALKIIKSADVCIELNTSGRDRPCGEFYPCDEFIGISSSMGIPVTLGSDAHTADELGRYFGEAIQLLKKLGYRDVSIFKKRCREQFKI
ncbi:histidinol-phosphatase HisJ family protein [bacterium]|nr:histidinol-phosphatase HisJ family protein [candidate division CSSED10-310 bacterium]